MEKRMVKVLKALAEATDMTLTELFEDVMLHTLEGHSRDTRGTLDVLRSEIARGHHGFQTLVWHELWHSRFVPVQTRLTRNSNGPPSHRRSFVFNKSKLKIGGYGFVSVAPGVEDHLKFRLEFVQYSCEHGLIILG
jgi:hypothetical protein